VVRLFTALKIAVARLLELDVPVVAGALAFFGVLSVFPSVALALVVYGLVATPDEASLLADAIKRLLPQDTHLIIEGELRLLSDWAAHHVGFGVLASVLLVAWSAMAGWKALISGIRLVTAERRHLTMVGYQFQSFVLSFLFIGAIAVTIMIYIVLVRVLAAGEGAGSAVGPSILAYVRAETVVWVVASIGIYIALLGIYRVAISRATASDADCARGALVGSVAWFLCVVAFDLYAEQAAWHTIYGRLAGSIAILLWFYVSAYAALFGAAVAAALKRGRGEAA
jgi:membrane protein